MLKFLIPTLATMVLVAGCGAKPATSEAGSQDHYAGLDQAIRAWRADIVKTEAACKGAAEQGCQGFEVACKVEREIAPDEQAKGVSAKVVAGMSWHAWSAAHGEPLPAAGFAEFTRIGSAWSRSGPLNGNLTTCETYGTKV